MAHHTSQEQLFQSNDIEIDFSYWTKKKNYQNKQVMMDVKKTNPS